MSFWRSPTFSDLFHKFVNGIVLYKPHALAMQCLYGPWGCCHFCNDFAVASCTLDPPKACSTMQYHHRADLETKQT
jgi:hypothetical protein